MTTPQQPRHTLALICTQNSGPSLLLTELDHSTAQAILDHHGKAQSSGRNVTYEVQPHEVRVMESLPEHTGEYTFPDPLFAETLTEKGSYVHPGDFADFERSYGPPDGLYSLREETWRVDRHGALLEVREKHTGETYTSQTLPADLLTQVRDQLLPVPLLTLAVDQWIGDSVDLLVTTVDQALINRLIEAMGEAAELIQGTVKIPSRPAYATERGDTLGVLIDVDNVVTLPGDVAAFAEAYGPVDTANDLGTPIWYVGEHQVTLSVVNETTGDEYEAEAISLDELRAMAARLANTEAVEFTARTPDGEEITGTIWGRPYQADVSFRQGGQLWADSTEIDTPHGALIADTDYDAGRELDQAPWIPKDSTGRETPWVDAQGRLWATEDLTFTPTPAQAAD